MESINQLRGPFSLRSADQDLLAAARVHTSIVQPRAIQHINHMQPSPTPKRAALRFDVKYELEEAAINERFFAVYCPELGDDYYSHLMTPNGAFKMHIVLDLHCKMSPDANIHEIAYEVYKVEKTDNLYVVLSPTEFMAEELQY